MRIFTLLLLLALAAGPAWAGTPVNDFGARLYNRLAAQGGNVFFSPYSIEVALKMTAGGAKGATRDELLKLLGGGEFAKIAARNFKEGNRVWVDKRKKLLPAFEAFTARFGAAAAVVDFAGNVEAARKTINSWVASQTADRIKELLPLGSVKEDTQIVLTNAVYFKDEWKRAFDEKSTRKAPFRLIPKGQTEVSMMGTTDSFAYGANAEVAVCELPYQGDFSMTVVLPHQPDGLAKVDKDFTPQKLDGYFKLLGLPTKVNVQLPSFKLDSKFALKNDLQALGLKLSFTDRADFSGMTGVDDLKIGQVYHGGFIEVNEKGTEAAAATAVVMVTKSMSADSKPVPLFRCDHPFLYAIRHRPSGTVVFMGRIANPKA